VYVYNVEDGEDAVGIAAGVVTVVEPARDFLSTLLDRADVAGDKRVVFVCAGKLNDHGDLRKSIHARGAPEWASMPTQASFVFASQTAWRPVHGYASVIQTTHSGALQTEPRRLADPVGLCSQPTIILWLGGCRR